MARTLPVISLALSALAWLGVLVIPYVGATWHRDLAVLLIAFIALIGESAPSSARSAQLGRR